MTTRALVLAGGGARGAFQVGMVKELTKRLDFQVIRGVSVGAINGAFLAQAPSAGDSQRAMQQQAAALEQVWNGLGTALSQIGSGQAPKDEFQRMEMMGAAFRQFIAQIIDPAKLAASHRDFTAGYVSLLSGQYQEAHPGDAGILELIRASAALPPLFPFVKMESDRLVDGGYRNITPLASAFKAAEKPDEVYVLLTRQIGASGGRLSNCAIEAQPLSPDWTQNEGDPARLYAQVSNRLVDILMDEVYIEDIKRAIQANALARVLDELERGGGATGGEKLLRRYAKALRRRPNYVKLYVLAPRRYFNPDAPQGHRDATDAFDPKLIAKAIEHGAAVAADESQWLWRPSMEGGDGIFG